MKMLVCMKGTILNTYTKAGSDMYRRGINGL